MLQYMCSNVNSRTKHFITKKKDMTFPEKETNSEFYVPAP